MREIKIGNKEIRVKATPLALLFYKQEFGKKADLIGDLTDMVRISSGDYSAYSGINLLQMAWAMNKADSYGKGEFPSFEKWLMQFEKLDFSDKDSLMALMEEAIDGFLPGARGEFQKSEGK